MKTSLVFFAFFLTSCVEVELDQEVRSKALMNELEVLNEDKTKRSLTDKVQSFLMSSNQEQFVIEFLFSACGEVYDPEKLEFKIGACTRMNPPTCNATLTYWTEDPLDCTSSASRETIEISTDKVSYKKAKIRINGIIVQVDRES